MTATDSNYLQLFGSIGLDGKDEFFAKCACVVCNSCTCACSCKNPPKKKSDDVIPVHSPYAGELGW